MITFNMEPAI